MLAGTGAASYISQPAKIFDEPILPTSLRGFDLVKGVILIGGAIWLWKQLTKR